MIRCCLNVGYSLFVLKAFLPSVVPVTVKSPPFPAEIQQDALHSPKTPALANPASVVVPHALSASEGSGGGGWGRHLGQVLMAKLKRGPRRGHASHALLAGRLGHAPHTAPSSPTPPS